MRYQTDGPFRPGQPTKVKVIDCPEGYSIEWIVKYGTVSVSPMTGPEVTVIPADELPAQVAARCCPPD